MPRFTPQELQDRDGFLLFSAERQRRVGEVIIPKSGMTKEPLVVIGEIPEDEAMSLARKNRIYLPKGKFYYKVIAE